jgi:plasmid stabilization system protein ParE
MKLCFEADADRKLDEILRTLEAENPAAARKLHRRFLLAFQRAQFFPDSGFSVPERPRTPLHQVFVCRRYRIYYIADMKRRRVWILDVWHAAQLARAPELPDGLGDSR